MEKFYASLVFLIPIAVGLSAQLIKFLIFTVRHGWHPGYIFTHGHMPSAHTAFAISLLTSIGYFQGIASGAFAVAVALAFVIVDDAVRIRMILGDQGRYLNMLIEQLNVDKKAYPRLKERVGHRTNEVLAGALFGFLMSLLLIWVTR
ncbi:MAG: divergent PAP2 family protein [Candidatus Moraniibacteriota bacterium]